MKYSYKSRSHWKNISKEKIRRQVFVVYLLIYPLSKFGGNRTNPLWVLTFYSVRFKWNNWFEKTALMHLSAAIPGGWPQGHTGEWRGICWLLSPIFGPGRGHWTAFALPRQDTWGKTCGICNIAAILIRTAWTGCIALCSRHMQAGETVCSLKLSFYDLQGIKLNLTVCRKQVD